MLSESLDSDKLDLVIHLFDLVRGSNKSRDYQIENAYLTQFLFLFGLHMNDEAHIEHLHILICYCRCCITSLSSGNFSGKQLVSIHFHCNMITLI